MRRCWTVSPGPSGRVPTSATPRDIYDALSLAVREELTLRWLATQRRVANAHVKRVCYFSVEYLPGRSLINALSSLDGDLVHEARSVLRGMGYELEDIAAQEVDPGLGNGGLGRLAACFLDSLATLHYPAVGYGIRYDYGIFTQVIDADGGQREVASSWLRLRNVWETPRGNAGYTVRFGGRSAAPANAEVSDAHRWVDTNDLYAIGFDQLIPGNGGPTVNHLRLWSGRAITPFQARHVQCRRLCGRGSRSIGGEKPVARAVSRRFDAAGQRASAQATVLLRERKLAGHLGDSFERGTLARLSAGLHRHSVE